MSNSGQRLYGRGQTGLQYILPPAASNNLPAPITPRSHVVICYEDPRKSRWKFAAVILGSIITGVTGVLAVWGGAVLTDLFDRAESHQKHDRPVHGCEAAETHFRAAIDLHDIGLKTLRLNDYIARFKGCEFYEDAVFALADITKSSRLSQDSARESAPLTQSQVSPATHEAPAGLLAETRLPPITVRPNSTYLSAIIPVIATINPGTTYRLRLRSSSTTTIHVLAGTVVLKIDSRPTLECVGGNTFHVFTRGWSTFELQSDRYSQIEVARIATGDWIRDQSDCTAPS